MLATLDCSDYSLKVKIQFQGFNKLFDFLIVSLEGTSMNPKEIYTSTKINAIELISVCIFPSQIQLIVLAYFSIITCFGRIRPSSGAGLSCRNGSTIC
jgi:hypothetical protein